MEFNVRIIPLDEDLTEFSKLLHLSFVSEVFNHASDGHIALTFTKETKPAIDYYLKYIYPSFISDLADSRIKNIGTETKNLGIFLANRWGEGPYLNNSNFFGVMFDTNSIPLYSAGMNGKPRECCALFTETIRDYANKKEKDITSVATRTLIHELGHIFNLKHSSTGDNFMSKTGDIIDEYKASTQFSLQDQNHLRTITLPENQLNLPGYSEFDPS